MPLISPDGRPVQIDPDQLAYINAAEAARPALEAQQHLLMLEHMAAGTLACLVLLAVLYCFRHLIRRATVATVRLVDRLAYALGVDSRRIAARWRERGAC